VTGGHCSMCGCCVWHSSLLIMIVAIFPLCGSDAAVVGATAGGPGEVPELQARCILHTCLLHCCCAKHCRPLKVQQCFLLALAC
jgi:hypothetical protein